MELFDILLQTGLVTTALVSYLIFFRRSSPIQFKGNYRQPGWNYPFRLLVARFAVKRWKAKRKTRYHSEHPRGSLREGWDCFSVRTSAPDGSSVLLCIRKVHHNPTLAEVNLHIKLKDGTTYTLPQSPEVSPWKTGEGWSAGGLTIEVLEEHKRLRILYNGLLIREGQDTLRHVRFNFIWASASEEVSHPEDWSDCLAARALALEPWRDGDWPSALGFWEDGDWHQWGALQGRFEQYDGEGEAAASEYLRVRGLRERAWAPRGYRGLNRVATLTAAARDGTAVMIRGFSYKDVLTVGYYGSVRTPDANVQSITDTDLDLANFCEHPGAMPDVFTVNVNVKNRAFKLMVRVNKDGGSVLSGALYQHEVHYRTVTVDIDGEAGTGVLELGYRVAKDKSGPSVDIPPISLKWTKQSEVGSVSYCASFETPAAACLSYVGGKGASLAVLASAQKDMGYRVPPGFCLTTKALEKHLEANPQLKSAILEIEAANEDYEENSFRDKCNKTVELFKNTEIAKDVREEVLSHLVELKKRAIEENLGPELRFAVRSSAVGEDSEALSAAGQNETILGCVSDADILRGIQLCWGSMFAFTSAYYRRQNGQPCLCGAGVVVQALVRARAAGVLFTRHPRRGDPARLLLTANYGLGESVVSGSVEPDTIIVARGKELSIAKIEVGSKKQRVAAVGDGVMTEAVAEAESKLPCVTVSESLQLAKIGVMLEEAWAAPRDIEWAVTKDAIWVLQARPITSLQQWTEEELLHELDTPVMSDDDMHTFANTGEVLPRPLSPLSFDLAQTPLRQGVDNSFSKEQLDYSSSISFTHNRVVLSLFNSFYRSVPKKLDLTIRMLELSVFGHLVMDDHLLRVAQHRHSPNSIEKIKMTFKTFWFLFRSKNNMKSAVKAAKGLQISMDVDDPMVLLGAIKDTVPVGIQCSYNHAITSAASTSSQIIAMMVLTEGGSELTREHQNEINKLFSSGGVVSAEVPQALAKFARDIEASGKFEDFKSQDPKKAMDWLKINEPKIHNDVCKFLEEHGHRGIMEFDLVTKPWALVPEEMMEILQNMSGIQEGTPQAIKTDAEIVDSLTTPKKPTTRKILRWLLPLCRTMVRNRETTKAHLILFIHKLRLAALRLGKLMVKHWYIPDSDLVFFFRHSELAQYLCDRDPAILKKAILRRQYHPSWCKLKFQEIYCGWVDPLESRGPRVEGGDVRLTATAVCGGEVVARACVVKELSEIGQLQRGDILITHSTDIGWSPYFPLVSGIVTELGGLISHGAVIAREYGLPCLVGAGEATDLFRTGDLVRLSAQRGVLEKVRIEDPAEDAEDAVS